MSRTFHVRHHRARKLGALGVYYPVKARVVAEHQDEAVHKFLNHYERLYGMPHATDGPSQNPGVEHYHEHEGVIQ